MKKDYIFPCEKCGAKLEFSTLEGELKCKYCSHINVIEKSFKNIVERDYEKVIATLKEKTEVPLEITSVKCNTCAAVFDTDENIHASTCPYCGSAIVRDTELYRPIKPQALLPFKIDKKEAKSIFKKWLKSLWFAPNKLKRYSGENSQLDGIFVPHWTYDANTFSHYSGRRGIEYQENERYTDSDGAEKTRSVTKVRWYNVDGELPKSFDDILVIATKSIQHKLHKWDLENLVDYNESYLSGYESEVYSVELDEGLKSAKEIMNDAIRDAVKDKIGGDRQEINHLDSTYSDITFKHLLLPVYASAFKFNGKVYSYVVNGRNGEITGERPYSFVKISVTLIGVLSVFTTLYYYFGTN